MSHRRRISAALAALAVAAIGLTLAACGGEETPTAIPAALRPKPATA
ncbi:MAG: BMP family ABC transporter substrate-binding protein, partial [Chloroflexi bacterium CFX6]|nr:BMP family ABC transporter substrate-binding protein [Chloroflexi bacterium CFX6]